MSVAAISAVSLNHNVSAQPASGPQTAKAQGPFAQVERDMQSSGVQAADSDPEGTMRSDMAALQQALSQGDLQEAQRAFTRLLADQQQIRASQTDAKTQRTTASPSALPKSNDNGEEHLGLNTDNNASTQSNSLDVYA